MAPGRHATPHLAARARPQWPRTAVEPWPSTKRARLEFGFGIGGSGLGYLAVHQEGRRGPAAEARAPEGGRGPTVDEDARTARALPTGGGEEEIVGGGGVADEQ